MPEEPGEVAAPDTVVAPETTPEAPSASTQEAVERAFEKVFGEDGVDVEPEVDTPPDEAQPRGPDGKFAAKDVPKDEPQDTPAPEQEVPPAEQTQYAGAGSAAPTRFAEAARAEWDKTPEPVRAEVNRAFREMESGIAQYRQAYEPLKQYDEMARASGTTLDAALQNYVGLENQLRQDPMRGLEAVCQNLGTTLRDVAAKVMGQPVPEKDAVIGGLQSELAALKQQIGGVQQTFQQQREAQTVTTVESFAAANPRFDELSGEIATMLKTGYATGLQDAYDKAARLNPAPAPAVPAAPPPAPQTRKSALSVNGAPTSGSNPANRQRSATTGDAISRAFEQVGLPTS